MPILPDKHGWVIETANTAYAIGVNKYGQLVSRYWGAKLAELGDYPPTPDYDEYASFNGPGQRNPEEYPTHSDLKYIEPCLKTTFHNGVRDTRVTFQRAILVSDADTIALVLTDEAYGLWVYLQYRVYEAFDLIERYVELQNKSENPITLERVLSAQWHLPIGDTYTLTHFTGKWNDEWHKHVEPLIQGVKVLESRRMTSSHHHNPSILLGRQDTTETSGECWFGALEWSGNWKFTAEVTDFAATRLSMGLNDWDFAYRLDPNTTFTTPSVFLGYTDKGYAQASHHLHDFIRQNLPHPQQPRKVLYNSWEATLFAVDEESQKRYAEIAAEIGVELFVMDDGWFNGRNSDSAGLGDWFPDPIKFPNGLKPLIEHVNALGMDFGLWIEPEMVNEDSDLYRAHPDWAIHFPNRPRTTARNQMVLNLAQEEVQNYLIEHLDALLSENNIAFIKWDMNRNVTEAGWQTDRNPREIWVRYVEGVYRVWGTLRERHPQVIWQSCSGGGGRTDMGILRLADQVWVSDNTEPTRRIPMQRNFSYIYPANTMEAWVTDMGSDFLPLSFRFHASMSGVLGIGANITKWGATERDTAKRLIAQYKVIRPIVQEGDVYRLNQHSTQSALQYVSKDKRQSVVFVYRTYEPNPSSPFVIRLRGLDPQKRYRVATMGEKSGLAWMHTDWVIALEQFNSRIIEIEEC